MVTLLVSDSDRALVAAFDGGKRLGRVDIPGDARAALDGARVVRPTFLAPLLSDEQTRRALADPGVRADATFVEESVEVIADALGLGDPLRGARYLLEDLPVDARVLCFERPAAQRRPEASGDSSGPVVLEIETCLLPPAVAGFQLSDPRSLSVRQTSGPPVSGITIEIQRRSIDGLELRAIRAWNPRIRNRAGASSTWIAAPIAQGDVVRVVFDEARLANVPLPSVDASLPQHLALARRRPSRVARSSSSSDSSARHDGWRRACPRRGRAVSRAPRAEPEQQPHRPCGMRRARGVPWLRRPSALVLHGCALGDDDVLEMLASPLLARLRNLALSENALGDATVRRLASCERLSWLEELDVCHNQFDALAAETRLRAAPALAGLRRLCV